MRIINGGGPRAFTHEAITGKMLMDYGFKNPDFIPTMMRLPELKSPLMSILDQKGLKTNGLNYTSNFTDGNYRTVSANVVEYRIESSDMRKEHFKANPDGVTYLDDANPTYPGMGKNEFYIYLDSDYLGYHEVMLLADGNTQLYIVSEGGKEMSNGSFEYAVKLLSDDLSDYVDPTIMNETYEVQLGMNLHAHDFSDRSTQVRIPMGAIGRTYLSLQRVMYSYSGTGAAMAQKGTTKAYEVVHVAGGKAQTMFLDIAQMQMLKDVARFTEFQILEGRSTVDVNNYNKVLIKDREGREIMAGSGIMHANDGPIEFPMPNGWNDGFLEALMTDIDPLITRGQDGNREAYLSMAPRAYVSFQTMMGKKGVTLNQNIVGDGATKGMIDTYAFYELAGLRLIVDRNESLAQRPGIPLKDGSKTNEWDTIVLPLGQTNGGRNGVEIVTLRPAVNGTVAGINEGGDVASSVDGSHKHMLWQIGVISQIQPIKIFRPYKNNTI